MKTRFGSKVVLLEFPNECEGYIHFCEENGQDPADAIIIALDVGARVWLKKRDIPHLDSLEFFPKQSHERCLRKSVLLVEWLGSQIDLTDKLGIRDAYANALQWYSRHFLAHFLWLAEVLNNIRNKYPGATFILPESSSVDGGFPRLQSTERYVGSLAKSICLEHGARVEEFRTPGLLEPRSVRKPSNRVVARLARLGVHLHRRALRRLSKEHPILVVSSGYQMQSLFTSAKVDMPKLRCVVFGELAKGSSLIKISQKIVNAIIPTLKLGCQNSAFDGEVWTKVLAQDSLRDERFIVDLTRCLENIMYHVEHDSDLFSHMGINFGHQFADKLRSGIGKAIFELNCEIDAMDQTLSILQPKSIVTPLGRRGIHALGQLATRRGIPGLLISHASFTPPKNELDKLGWKFHSYGMFYGSYSHAAIQTPMSAGFSEHLSTSSKFLKTGPLIWGRNINRSTSSEFKRHLLGEKSSWRVVTHASTSRDRAGIHFQVYETPDEYIQTFIELINAVESVPNTLVIIKVKPSFMPVEDLRLLLPESDKYVISADESFSDVLGITDLLVSFSSTTIEESLLNGVPVLLYGSDGRYQHIQGEEVDGSGLIDAKPVYVVRSSQNLSKSIECILQAVGGREMPRQLFSSYVFNTDEVPKFSDTLNLLSADSIVGRH